MLLFYDKRLKRPWPDPGWTPVREGELKAECEDREYDG